MESLGTGVYEVLEVRGSPRDRGFAYGQKHSDRLKKLLESHYNFYSLHLNTAKDEALREASKYASPIRDYSEDVAEELEGTAEGAGVQAEEVLLVTAFNEIFYPRLKKNCTSFAVRGTATSDGLTYVGQDNDEGIEPWLDGECTTLTRYVQKDAPTALIYTYVGAPAMMGINSEGLSVCINALAYPKVRVGVPLLAVTREVMNQRTLDGALEAVERASRSYSINFVLGTPEGIVDLETYPDEMFVHRSDDVIYHANHCLYSEGYEFENTEYRANSITRCDRMGALIGAHRGNLDLKRLQAFLSDHEGKPHTICRHPDPSKPHYKRARTLDGMIFVPEKREAWFAKGNPCETPFVRYPVCDRA